MANRESKLSKKQYGASEVDAGWKFFFSEQERLDLGNRLQPLLPEIRKISNSFFKKNGVDEETAFNALNSAVWYEATQAYRWFRYSQRTLGPGDSDEIQSKYDAEIKSALLQASDALYRIRHIDKQYGVIFDDALAHAAITVASDDIDLDTDLENPNTEFGFENYACSAKTRKFIENQMALRIGFFSDKFLDVFYEKICSYEKMLVTDKTNRFGCLRISPAIPKTSVQRINVETLGLAARLAYRFREFTSGRYVTTYWPGIEMPADGRPCWPLVAQVVNATFKCSPEITEGGLRQRWSDLSQRGEVRIDPWPQLVDRI